MKENINNPHNTNDPCIEEKEKIDAELKYLRKKEKIFKIIVYTLIIIVVIISVMGYVIYSKFKKIQASVEAFTQDPSFERNVEELVKKVEETYHNQNVIVGSVSYQNSSLSMIVKGGELTVDNEKLEEMKNIYDDYSKDPEFEKFISFFKNDPDFKDILESDDKERPKKFLKKMNDPKFMQKMTEKLITNPDIMKYIMKMSNDERIQNAIKSNFIKEIKVSTSTK